MRKVLSIGFLLSTLSLFAWLNAPAEHRYVATLGGEPYLVTVDNVLGQITSTNAKRIQRLSAGPTCSSSTAGTIYYDTDDNIVYYCNGTSYVSMATTSVDTLDELSDVTITSVATNDSIIWNGSAWVNSSPNFTMRADDDGTVALVTGDIVKKVTAGHASANAVSIAEAGTMGFEAGWFTNFCTTGAGVSTITPTTSTINGAATLTLPQYWCAGITSNGTNYLADVRPYFTSKSGNTNVVGTTSGTLTSGNCAKFDANGNIVDHGATCGGGSNSTFIVSQCGGVVGTGNGTAYVLEPWQTNTNSACTNTGTLEGDVPVSCTAKNLRVRATSAGAVAGSGVVALFVGGSASALTCTLGTGTSCSDLVNTVALTAGTSTISVKVTTGQASDTTASIRAVFECTIP